MLIPSWTKSDGACAKSGKRSRVALTLEIAGVDRTAWLAAGSCSWSRPLGGRATANAILEDRGRGFTPSANSTFVVKDGATKYFAGTIYSIVERCHPPLFTKQFTLRVLDYNHICDRRRVAAITYSASPALTLRDIVLEIVGTSLDGEGITTTNVATGPTILEPVTFNYETVTEAFNKLSAITANYGDPYLWSVDFDKGLTFSQFSSVNAPFSLTNTSNNFKDFEIERSMDGFRSIQHARTEWEIAPTLEESFTGNSVLVGFITTQPITDTPTVYVNGIQKTVGELGVDNTGKDFYWIRDGYGIFNQDHATLTALQTLEVVYVPPATNIVTVSDSTAISTYGKWEAVREERNLQEYDTLVAVATGDLSMFKTVPAKPSFTVYQGGLAPGQRISINLTRHGINDDYLIEDTQFKWVPARTDFLECRVKCTSQQRPETRKTAWLEKLVRVARIGRPPQQITGESGGGTTPGGVGGWSERPSGSMNGTNTVFTLAAAPSPSTALILAINGVVLRPGVDYTISGNTITLNTAPLSTDWLRAWYDLGYSNNAEEPTNTSPLGGIYTVSAAPLSGTLLFFVNGIVALNGTDYTLSSATIDFSTAPDVSDWELAWYSTFATSGYSYGETPSGSINGSNTAFTLAATPSGVMVVVNGILQAEGLDYTRSGNTITFLTAPSTGDWIRVWSKQ